MDNILNQLIAEEYSSCLNMYHFHLYWMDILQRQYH